MVKHFTTPGSPHLFIFYTAPNYNVSGLEQCYDLDCPAFVASSPGAQFLIGGSILPYISGFNEYLSFKWERVNGGSCRCSQRRNRESKARCLPSLPESSNRQDHNEPSYDPWAGRLGGSDELAGYGEVRRSDCGVAGEWKARAWAV